MNKQKRIAGIMLTIVFCLLLVTTSYAQFGNSISGHIFGTQREPLSDVTVELLDDFSRSIGRVRTDSSGRYFFNRISAGRFRVRVLSLGTDFQEQEQEVEIQNMTRTDSRGNSVTSAFANVQRDFYLRPRRTNNIPNKAETIFVQEIPADAKKLYDEAVKLLDDPGKSQQGLEKLKSSVELFPDYYNALERLGAEYIKSKHFRVAQILLQKAVEINSRSYKGWYELAYALYSLDAKDNAIEAAEKALSLNSNSTESLLLLGTLLRQTGNYKESEKRLLAAKELAAGLIPEINWQLSLLYSNNLKRYDKAADELELFLKARPNSKDAESIKKLISELREKSRKK